MPTMPITAVYCLTSMNKSHIILQYADGSRSKPALMTAEKQSEVQELLSAEEWKAYVLAERFPNQWVNV